LVIFHPYKLFIPVIFILSSGRMKIFVHCTKLLGPDNGIITSHIQILAEKSAHYLISTRGGKAADA